MVEISDKEYIEFLKYKNDLLETELNKKQLRTKEEKNFYDKTYFKNVSSFKSRHCKCCDVYVKYNSYSNHIKGKTHLKNFEKLNFYIE